MAELTRAQLAGELTKRIQETEKALDSYREVTEFRLRQLEAQMADRQRYEELLLAKVSDLSARNAVVEERCRTLEKNSDRGWNLTQALIILALSVALSAVTSFLTQSLLKKP